MSNAKSKILVVEDDEATQHLIRRFLERSGFEVLTAADGWDAFTSALNEKPDLVLLDLMMPKMDGFGFMQALRASTASHLPVIVTSALADAERQTQALDLGAREYLVKSKFTLAQLLETINRQLPPLAVATHA